MPTDLARERRRSEPGQHIPGEVIRVVVVDSQALFRAGIADAIAREAGMDVVAEVADIAAACDALAVHGPAIVLLDLTISGPEMAGMQRIKREHPAAGVIALSARDDGDLLFESTKAGAAAYVTRNIAPDALLDIIRRAHDGEYLVNEHILTRPDVADRVLREFRGLAAYGAGDIPVFAPLSPREMEILDCIATGMTNKQVAYAMSISEQTVKNHMSSILRKLSVNDRTQAVVYAIQQGWISIPVG